MWKFSLYKSMILGTVFCFAGGVAFCAINNPTKSTSDLPPEPTDGVIINGPSTLSGLAGVSGTEQYTATDNLGNDLVNPNWEIESPVPSGISINPSTGLLSWVAAANIYNFRIKCTDIGSTLSAGRMNVKLTLLKRDLNDYHFADQLGILSSPSADQLTNIFKSTNDNYIDSNLNWNWNDFTFTWSNIQDSCASLEINAMNDNGYFYGTQTVFCMYNNGVLLDDGTVYECGEATTTWLTSHSYNNPGQEPVNLDLDAIGGTAVPRANIKKLWLNNVEQITVAPIKYCGCLFFHLSDATDLYIKLPQTITSVNNEFCSSMFKACYSMHRLSENFQIPQSINTVIDGGGNQMVFCYMFQYCGNLEYLNSTFNLPQLLTTTTPYFALKMFEGCQELKKLSPVFNLPQQLSSAATSSFSNMFLNCKKLTIDNTQTYPPFKIPDISFTFGNVFYGCDELIAAGVPTTPPRGAEYNILRGV